MRWQLRLGSVLLFVVYLFGIQISQAFAQQQKEEKDGLPPRYAAQRKEASFFCGPFLPNQIKGITELMTLCGARLGFKINDNTWLESSFISGSGSAQQYKIGSLSFRTDVAYDDIIASFNIGGDVHMATQPLYDAFGNTSGDQSNIYLGGHAGGSLWAKINDALYLRTDMTFNFSPGTSLFIGFGLVFRFDPGSGGQDSGSSSQH